jgi:SAM-dependent methyltransferase
MTDTPWFQRAFDAPYLEVYAHRDDAEARRATQALLQPQVHPGDVVLDLACGAGRWLPHLEAAGARAIGVDLSADLLAQAARLRQECGASFAILRGNMLQVPLRDASCDLALSLFTSFGYFETRQEDLAMLREVRRVLRPHGLLLLDVFNAQRVRRELVPRNKRIAGRYEVRESRRIDADRGVVIKDIELRRDSDVFRYREEVRLWERSDLVAALEEGGFVVQRTFGDYDGGEFDDADSPRLILLAAAEPSGAAMLDSRRGGAS